MAQKSEKVPGTFFPYYLIAANHSDSERLNHEKEPTLDSDVYEPIEPKRESVPLNV